MKARFPKGLAIGKQQIDLTNTSFGELTHSKSSEYMAKNDPVMYADKLNAAANANDVLRASTDYVNEPPNHPRRDDITDFGRGKVLLRIGQNDYVADVLVGNASNGGLILYDIVWMKEAEHTLRQYSVGAADTDSSPAADDGGSLTAPFDNNMPQGGDYVNGKNNLQYAVSGSTFEQMFGKRENRNANSYLDNITQEQIAAGTSPSESARQYAVSGVDSTNETGYSNDTEGVDSYGRKDEGTAAEEVRGGSGQNYRFTLAIPESAADLYFDWKSDPEIIGADVLNSERFREITAGTVAVDENGTPIIGYHGTRAKFTRFSEQKSNSKNFPDTVGYCFTVLLDVARLYAETSQQGNNESPVIYPSAFVMKNPVVLNADLLDQDYRVQNSVLDHIRQGNKYVGKLTQNDFSNAMTSLLHRDTVITNEVANIILNAFAQVNGPIDGAIIKNAKWDGEGSPANDQYIVFDESQIIPVTKKYWDKVQKARSSDTSSRQYAVSGSTFEQMFGKRENRNANSYLDNITKAQYDRYAWARQNDVLTKQESKDLEAKIRDAQTDGKIPRTADGHYIFAVGSEQGVNNVLVVSDGKYGDHSIDRVYRLDATYETVLEKVRDTIYGYERSRPGEESVLLIDACYGEGLVQRHTLADAQSYDEFRQSIGGREAGSDGRAYRRVYHFEQDGEGDTGEAAASQPAGVNEFHYFVDSIIYERDVNGKTRQEPCTVLIDVKDKGDEQYVYEFSVERIKPQEPQTRVHSSGVLAISTAEAVDVDIISDDRANGNTSGENFLSNKSEAHMQYAVSGSTFEQMFGKRENRNANSYLDNITKAQYDRYAWARQNDVLTKQESKDLEAKIRDAQTDGKIPRTADGHYIFAVGSEQGVNNVLVVSDGKYGDHSIDRVYRIDLEYEDLIEEVRDTLYGAEREVGAEAYEIGRAVFGETIVERYAVGDVQSYDEFRKAQSAHRAGSDGRAYRRVYHFEQDGEGDTGEAAASQPAGVNEQGAQEAPGLGASSIRYAISGDSWEAMLAKYGVQEPGKDPRARDIEVPKQVSDNKYVSLTVRSILESAHVKDDI